MVCRQNRKLLTLKDCKTTFTPSNKLRLLLGQPSYFRGTRSSLNLILTGNGMNQPIYSYHVTQAGRNMVSSRQYFVVVQSAPTDYSRVSISAKTWQDESL